MDHLMAFRLASQRESEKAIGLEHQMGLSLEMSWGFEMEKETGDHLVFQKA